MQEVIEFIKSKKEVFSQHPFFQILSDNRLSLPYKLKFMPYMAHFIMSFGDINKYVLPFKTPKDKFEVAINIHAKEDEKHWIWYLEDLKSLNFDKNLKFTIFLEYLWGNDLSASRELTYKLVSLIYGQPAIKRYIVIEVMEATGNVTFVQLEKMTTQSGLKLNFIGELHLSHETGHAMLEEANVFENIELNERDRAEFKNIINECFDAFYKFMDQLYLNTKQD